MLFVTFEQMFLSLLITILFSFVLMKDKNKMIYIWIMFISLFLIKLGISYFTLPSRDPFWLIFSNVLFGIIVLTIDFPVIDDKDKNVYFLDGKDYSKACLIRSGDIIEMKYTSSFKEVLQFSDKYLD